MLEQFSEQEESYLAYLSRQQAQMKERSMEAEREQAFEERDAAFKERNTAFEERDTALSRLEQADEEKVALLERIKALEAQLK